MRNTFLGQIKWRRLIIIGAVVVLAVAVWTSQIRSHSLPSAGQSAVLMPSAAAAGAPPGAPAGTPEVQTQAHPQDPAGWRALGETRFAAGQYGDAVPAYERAVALAPSHAVTWSALGEARVMASAHDPMPAEALKDFRQAGAIDPKEPRARYFLAVAKDLTGDHGGAIGDWLALLADTPPGAPWEADLRRTIAQVGRIHHIAVTSRMTAIHQPTPLALPAAPPMAGIAGPTTEDLQAASAIPPSQQQAMAQAMVARLEQRLAADPHNADGWVMLIRSRMTLDGPEKASAVLARAVVADPADAAQLRERAQALGVK